MKRFLGLGAAALGFGLMSLGMAAETAVSAGAGDCCGPTSQSARGMEASVVMLAEVGAATSTAPAAVDVGNTKCPIMGDDADKEVTYTHEGKTYHFCCKDCIATFKKNPDKYIKAMESNPEKYGIKK